MGKNCVGERMPSQFYCACNSKPANERYIWTTNHDDECKIAGSQNQLLSIEEHKN